MRTQRYFPVIVLFAAAILYWVCRQAYFVGFFNDDAFYIIGAKSFLLGGYADLTQPGHPPQTNYMPGFPLLLAPVVGIFSGSLLACQVFSILLAVGGLFFFWRIIGETGTFETKAAALLIAAFNPLMVSLSAQVLSDIAFFVFSMGTIDLARRRWESSRQKDWLVLAALTGFNYYIRPVGLALGLGILIALAVERRWKLFAVFAGGLGILIFPFATTQVSIYLYEIQSPLQSAPADNLSVGMLKNLLYYLNEMFVRNIFRWPLSSSFLSHLAVGVGLVFTGMGVVFFKASGWKKLLFPYLAMHAGLYLVWSKQSGRYLYPVFPFVVFFFLQGLVHAVKNPIWRRPFLWGATALIFLCYLPPLHSIAKASLFLNTPITRPSEETYAWVRSNTPPEAVFVAELDGTFFLYTDRYVYHLPKIYDSALLLRWFNQMGIGYFVLDRAQYAMRTHQGNTPHDPYPYAVLAEMVKTHPNFKMVYENPLESLIIYRIDQNKGNP